MSAVRDLISWVSFNMSFYHYDKQQHPSHVKWVLFSRMGLIAGGALALPLLNLMVILK